jgi:uncharacterized protein YutE (UPF0331/DUF86 family)
LVDADRAEARIERLEELIERLEGVRKKGEDAYLGDAELRAMTERWLEIAIQVCIDLGTQVVMEQSAPAPSNYADIFKILGQKGLLSEELAGRLGNAARQRNLLVHLYMEVDDRAVFASLAFLDDLRQFAVFAQGKVG